MANNVNNVAALNPLNSASTYSKLLDDSRVGDNTDFATILKNAISNTIGETQSIIDGSEAAEIDFSLGNAESSNQLGIAEQKASIAVAYTVALRDRFLDAYKEIMQLQI